MNTPHQDGRNEYPTSGWAEGIPRIRMSGRDTPQQNGNRVKGILDRTAGCFYNANQQVKAGDQ